MVKLLMNWDIKTGHEQSYFEFVMQEFAPGLMRLGLQPTEAWYTVYGQRPPDPDRCGGQRPADHAPNPRER